MTLWGLRFPQKNERKSFFGWNRTIFVCFFEEIEDIINHFEINWPLAHNDKRLYIGQKNSNFEKSKFVKNIHYSSKKNCQKISSKKIDKRFVKKIRQKICQKICQMSL